jgi:hypothetical protein
MTAVSANVYSTQLNGIDWDAWCEHAASFKDASLYQCWLADRSATGMPRAERGVLRRATEVVAAWEARLFQLPLTSRGIVYVFWGPIWKRSAGDDVEVLRQALRAMRDEFVVRRGMVLRVAPRIYVEQAGDALRVFAEEGFATVPHARASRTLTVDLRPDLAEVHANLDKKWRNCLTKAERSGLEIVTGSSVEFFDRFEGIYRRMLERKRFVESADLRRHRAVQQELPEHLKMQVVIAEVDGQPAAGAIYSAIGDTAVYLFGATDEAGMRVSASYLVQWTILEHLKTRGVQSYDLNGIDPVFNPGVYRFKRGLAGKTATELTFAGQLQALEASLTNTSLLALDRLRRRVRLTRAARFVRKARVR